MGVGLTIEFRGVEVVAESDLALCYRIMQRDYWHRDREQGLLLGRARQGCTAVRHGVAPAPPQPITVGTMRAVLARASHAARRCVGLAVLALLALPAMARAETQTLFLRLSATPVPAPGGSTSTYLDSVAPSGTSATVRVTIAKGASGSFPPFTARAFAGDTMLLPMASAVVYLSSDVSMNGCADVVATVTRAGGAGGTLGQAVLAGSGIVAGQATALIVTASLVEATVIHAGESVALVLSVSNRCKGQRTVTLSYDAPATLSRLELKDSMTEVYGAAGTFGTLGSTLPSGQPVTKTGLGDWRFNPGQTAYFPGVASDGTVFIANLPQTFNQLLPTACDMVVSCFNRSSPVCAGTDGGRGFFTNIHIPTGVDNYHVPSDVDCGTLVSFQAGGADIGDVELVPDPLVGERVLFGSSWASLGSTNPDRFPTFGTLARAGGVWSGDMGSNRTPLQLQQLNPPPSVEGCPNHAISCCSDADCGPNGVCQNPACFFAVAGTCSIPCQGDADCGTGQSCMDGQCGLASCDGLGEMVRLPQSGRIAFVEYFGPRVIVADTTGVILGSYGVPPVTNPCGSGTLVISPREVDVDPTSVLGDERFVVVYDTSDPRGQPVQEFRYNEFTRTMAPTSAPFFPSSAPRPASTCGQQRQVATANYDQDGHLWVERSTGIGGGPVDIYLKDPTTGMRRLEAACSFLLPWGTPCVADVETPPLAWSTHVLEDVATRSVFLIAPAGRVMFIERTERGGGPAFSIRSSIDLGVSLLEAPAADERRTLTKATIDGARRALWVPVSTAETYPSCGYLNCRFPVGQTRDAWIYRLDIDPLLAFGPRVTQATSPSGVMAAQAFTVQLDSNQTASLDAKGSNLNVYVNGSATPSASVRWTRTCSAGRCTYAATVSGGATAGTTGALVWDATILTRDGASTRTLGYVKIL